MARKLENSVKTIETLVVGLKRKVEDQSRFINTTVGQVTRDYLDKYKVTNEDGGRDSSPNGGYASEPPSEMVTGGGGRHSQF